MEFKDEPINIIDIFDNQVFLYYEIIEIKNKLNELLGENNDSKRM